MFSIKRLGGLGIAVGLGVGVLFLASNSSEDRTDNGGGQGVVVNQPSQPNPASNSSGNQGAPASTPGSGASAGQPEKSPGEKLLEVVPDGGSISFDDLTKKVGPEVSGMFAWAKPKTISRSGNHFIIECEPGASVSAGGITLNLAEKVEADLTVHDDGVELKNVKGANVSWAGFNLLKVRHVRLQRDGTDKVKVTGKAEISRFLPYVPFNVTLSADDLK